MATCGADGRIDLWPKGDPPGFVRVCDAVWLAIPDRPGNNRLDSFANLIANPAIGLIFLIPGRRETLRLTGRSKLVRDAELAQEMAVNGREPTVIVIVGVEDLLLHCPKCMIRASLWSPETWPDPDALPSLAARTRLGDPEEAVRDALGRDCREGLY